MTLTFYKYQGTGNDFVIIDNRKSILSKNNTKLFARLCDRKFGIGADGLMLLELPQNKEDDFTMVYFNADGNESSMCGNGGRCLVAFAAFLGVIKDQAVFTAIDGKHKAEIKDGLVHLQMQNVSEIEEHDSHLFLDTGSPHHVTLVNELQNYDVVSEGQRIRNGAPYFESGSNVNFVEKKNGKLFSVRTYERGVENETLSCGTGVTAVALSMYQTNQTDSKEIDIETPGGALKVTFQKKEKGYQNIFLIGPAEQVFKGEIEC
ncbi:diaminopimelate epimerase [Aquimarina sp. AD10]|uniref:Diaminopimelate epimerase n=1 Tax=Aquimarina aggregata TaxID=1642818 RepID=A0A162CT98_9FLAO|nr:MULTISPECIES: diaminopimelate epimerase [Aquimarina]AXT63476.1 diaminopimelate epimerase [Aquimarina sp. AD10]KZS41834.1 diaminopimelate epimerase [Aquimarina aggregata]RKM99806.1 diaminopimelate epimerase [Aquimarina sp. AD10]